MFIIAICRPNKKTGSLDEPEERNPLLSEDIRLIHALVDALYVL